VITSGNYRSIFTPSGQAFVWHNITYEFDIIYVGIHRHIKKQCLLSSILQLFISCDDAVFNLILSKGSLLVGTGLLWWTYADLKHQLDNTPESEILKESVQNESAFLVYSILATVITVNLFIFNTFI